MIDDAWTDLDSIPDDEWERYLEREQARAEERMKERGIPTASREPEPTNIATSVAFAVATWGA